MAGRSVCGGCGTPRDWQTRHGPRSPTSNKETQTGGINVRSSIARFDWTIIGTIIGRMSSEHSCKYYVVLMIKVDIIGIIYVVQVKPVLIPSVGLF